METAIKVIPAQALFFLFLSDFIPTSDLLKNDI